MDANPALYRPRANSPRVARARRGAAHGALALIACMAAASAAETYESEAGRGGAFIETQTPDAATTTPSSPGARPAQSQLSEPLQLELRDDPPRQAAALMLTRVADFLAAGEFDSAENLLDGLQTLPMSRMQSQAFKLRQAQLEHLRGRHKLSIGLLRLLDDAPDLSLPARAELLLLLADAQQAIGRDSGAAETLLRRDKLPLPQRLAMRARIFDIIDSLGPLSLLLLRENAPDAEGWIALSEILNAPPAERLSGARLWRAHYPGHAATRLLHRRLNAGMQYRHIAMLLPLTSAFGEPARAFYEGFMAAHAENDAARRPEVSLHDIGDDPAIAPLYAQAAIDGGADFLVGPLGRNAVGALLEAEPPQAPALLIGGVPPDKAAPDLYGISLSPQQEAMQIAERAFLDGRRRAGIFRIDSESGRRIAEAFALRWGELGGALIGNAAFPGDLSDHSPVIRKLLGLDQSITRARILGLQLDLDLEFTPRRRDDIDFLFIAANAAEARLLAPQLRFFQAHNLALYSTSQIFEGKPNPVIDADLDGIIFGDLNWMLDALQPVDWRAPSPYHHTELDRLYALGMESYYLIPALADLRREPWRRYFGEAAEISVRENGNVRRHPAWAQFKNGLPTRLPPPPPVDKN
ncbi:MAG: penicillin-binding protein activator [Gammaproteobacteria bacterium]